MEWETIDRRCYEFGTNRRENWITHYHALLTFENRIPSLLYRLFKVQKDRLMFDHTFLLSQRMWRSFMNVLVIRSSVGFAASSWVPFLLEKKVTGCCFFRTSFIYLMFGYLSCSVIRSIGASKSY